MMRRTLPAVLPALVVTLPLVGHSILGDDRRRLYSAAARVGSNPLEAFRQSWRSVGGFLDRGNFRLVGRAVEYVERAVVFDIGEATGLPAHAVYGVLRIVLVCLVAASSHAVVSAVLRSAGAASAQKHPAAVLFPMVLAAQLVAGDHYSPLTGYMLVTLGSVAVILAVGVWIARDGDMVQRRLAWHEPVAMIAGGAILAATYDLAYLAPLFGAAFVAARVLAGRLALGLRPLWDLASVRRWLLFSVGFLAVLVPVRVEIAERCRQATCYEATNVEVSVDAVGRTLDRLATGLAPAGWRHASDLSERAGVLLGVADLTRNFLLAALLAAVACTAFVCARRACRQSAIPGEGAVPAVRTAAILGGLGLVTALMPSLMIGLAERTQDVRPAVGEAWRETVLVQVGWSFVASALLIAVFAGAGSGRCAPAVIGLAAAVLGAAMTLTLVSNAQVAYADRVTPLHAITAEMATAAIHFDPTPSGNARRCSLVSAYTAILPGPTQWVSGPQVGAELDGLMLKLHDQPFCDPAREAASAP